MLWALALCVAADARSTVPARGLAADTALLEAAALVEADGTALQEAAKVGLAEDLADPKQEIWGPIIGMVIISSWIAPCYNLQNLGNFLGAIGSLTAFLWVFVGGVWSEWRSGAAVGGWGLFVIIIAVLDMLRLCCVCCCTGLLIGFVVMNPAVAHMAAVNEKLTPEQRRFFQSEDFNKKCLELYLAAGGVPGGKLKMKDLRSATLNAVQPEEAARLEQDPLFREAFEQNADAEIDFDSFKQIIQYMMVQAGAAGVARVPERQEFEVTSKTTVEEVV